MARIRSIELTVGDIAISMGATALPEAPPCPAPVSDGVVDIENERWRFRAGAVKTYLRYGPSVEKHYPSILAVYKAR